MGKALNKSAFCSDAHMQTYHASRVATDVPGISGASPLSDPVLLVAHETRDGYSAYNVTTICVSALKKDCYNYGRCISLEIPVHACFVACTQAVAL
jgi:hypothetical protein